MPNLAIFRRLRKITYNPRFSNNENFSVSLYFIPWIVREMSRISWKYSISLHITLNPFENVRISNNRVNTTFSVMRRYWIVLIFSINFICFLDFKEFNSSKVNACYSCNTSIHGRLRFSVKVKRSCQLVRLQTT